MKKILVIMIMVLLCSTAVMGQAKKRTARKPKAKTERAMTEFEKWQKEEYLAYLLKECKRNYDVARTMESRGYFKKSSIETRYREAERYKAYYENLEKTNYYVDFNDYRQVYYNGGEIISISVSEYNGATCIFGQDPSEKEKTLGEELVKRINQEIGYDTETVNNRKNQVKDFINKHK